MTLSIRLPENEEQKLRDYVASSGESLSTFVRYAIEDRMQKEIAMGSPYSAGEHVFGRYGNGDRNAAANRKQTIRDKIQSARNH